MATGHVETNRFLQSSSISVSGERQGQDTTTRYEAPHAAAALSKIEQIVEYLKVLYK
jgi:hypothetical protein